MKYLKYIFLAIFAFLIIFLLLLIPVYGNFKNGASLALKAKAEISDSLNYLKAGKLQEAEGPALLAEKLFSDSRIEINGASDKFIFKYLPFMERQLKDLNYLLSAGEISSRSLARIIPLAITLEESTKVEKFVSLDAAAKNNVLKLIYESEPELKALKANLELAYYNLDKIKRIGVLYPVYGQISDLKEQLEVGLELISKLPALSQVLPALAGYPQDSRYLVIMHNTDELRPSGGFIGVFGLLEVSSGEIKNLSTHDSYHLDMPASISDNWNQTPPEPLSKYLKVEKWYLRDANWSPDWPTSATNILNIYHGEKKAIGEESGDFSGVVGISPDFVADLIELVGDIEARGDVYNKDNFQELLQYSVEVSYKEQEISSWDRKDVINDIVAELKDRLFNLPKERMTDFLAILDKHVASKNIQLYFTKDYLNNLAIDFGAGGEVKNQPGDYFLAVDANLAAFKSDAVVEKKISYELDLGTNQVEANLSYNHQGGFDWRTTRYRSYTRVYAPFGSSLESITSSGQVKIDNDSIKIYQDEDLNKTVFAAFFSLEPGTSGSLNFKYNLPSELKSYFKDNPYRLLVQKQSGRRNQSFEFKLKYAGEIKREEINYTDGDFVIE